MFIRGLFLGGTWFLEESLPTGESCVFGGKQSDIVLFRSRLVSCLLVIQMKMIPYPQNEKKVVFSCGMGLAVVRGVSGLDQCEGCRPKAPKNFVRRGQRSPSSTPPINQRLIGSGTASTEGFFSNRPVLS